jgi:hypothetical protein
MLTNKHDYRDKGRKWEKNASVFLIDEKDIVAES